jgi:hypothetical protein
LKAFSGDNTGDHRLKPAINNQLELLITPCVLIDCSLRVEMVYPDSIYEIHIENIPAGPKKEDI